MSKVWTRDGDKIKRYGAVVAEIVDVKGQIGWKWAGDEALQRYGFSDNDAVIEDVKYFHRYNPAKVALNFKSGKRVEFR